MNLDNIKDNLSKFITSKNLKVFEISYNKNETTLSILLDEDMKMDDIEKISNEISEYLDQYENEFVDNYILDVSTVGAERPIKNEEEVIQAVGKYVFVKTKESTINGDLEKYEEGKLYLSYKDKTKISKAVIDYKDVKQMRYAIKF